MLSLAHIALSVISLFVGAIVFLKPKGSRLHKKLGVLYSSAMIGLNAAALAIYNLTGHFNLFHFTAILSLLLVLIGWGQVIFRRQLKNWLYRHYVYMCWSYLALVAAALNESFVRVSPLKAIVNHYGNWVIIIAQAFLVTGAALLITRNKTRILSQFAGIHSQNSPQANLTRA